MPSDWKRVYQTQINNCLPTFSQNDQILQFEMQSVIPEYFNKYDV